MKLTYKAAKLFSISRRNVKDALKNGLISVNGRTIRKDTEVSDTDIIIYSGEKNPLSFDPADFLLFRNEWACFLYKPPFIHSQRLKPEDTITLSDVWEKFPGYVPLSRLDYGVDGVVAAAAKNMEIKSVEKKYLAVVTGKFPEELVLRNLIDACKRKKVKVTQDLSGRPALMRLKAFNGRFSMIEVSLEKAARHQVRAFCAYSGHPILGDVLYGGETFPRICLHCYEYRLNGICVSSGEYAQKFCEQIDFNRNL